MSVRSQIIKYLGLTDRNPGRPAAPITEKLVESDQDVTFTGAVTLSNAEIKMASLPASDPTVAGRLYTAAGVVKVSAG